MRPLSPQFDAPPPGSSTISTDHGAVEMWYEPDERRMYLANLLVDPAERGQGHGEELVRMVAAHLDKHGLEGFATAAEEMHPWYARHGFVPNGEERLGLPILIRPRR